MPKIYTIESSQLQEQIRPEGVVSYKRVEKIKGIRYITFDTEADIIERLNRFWDEEDEFDKWWK